MYRKYFKHALDIVFAAIILLLSWPIMLIVAIAIVLEDPSSSPLFTQVRAGLNEQPFKIYKFRSMKSSQHRAGNELKRMLKVGAFIRKTSLDELPQIINIFKNEMSFIGPRPLYPDYLPYYTKREHLRHTVLPGISGLAQVSGRNSATWEERFECDVQYVETISFINDAKIFFKTIANVLKEKDVHLPETQSLKDFDVYRQEARGVEEREISPI